MKASIFNKLCVYLQPISTDILIRHKNLLLRIGNIAAPVLAVAALVFTVHFWMNQDFGLVLDLGGEEIATVESEQTLEQAADMVNQPLFISLSTSFIYVKQLSL